MYFINCFNKIERMSLDISLDVFDEVNTETHGLMIRNIMQNQEVT